MKWRRLSRCCKPSFEPLRRGPRVLGAGDRAHDDDSAGARRQHLGQPLFVDSADREPRFVRCQFGGGRGTRSRPGAGRPGLVGGPAEHGPTQKSVDGPIRESTSSAAAALACARSWVDRPITGRGPMMSRAIGSGRSSWPRCSTSAPAANAMSARSLTASSAPWRRAASASISSASSSCRASSGPNCCSPAEPLSRSWMMSTPPASAASANSARSPRSRRASVQRYSDAVASLSPGVCTRRTVAPSPE